MRRGDAETLIIVKGAGTHQGTRGSLKAFITSRPELRDVRTRVRPTRPKGVRERAFGSLKYESLYRNEIADAVELAYRRRFAGANADANAWRTDRRCVPCSAANCRIDTTPIAIATAS